jgi:S1-C subfamily serine protease
VTLPDAAKPAAGQDRGLMVMQVAAEGPAGKAGVLAGDILTSIDGLPAAHPRGIARQFGPESIGRQVELRLIRSGAALALSATITARPAG